jgi:signal transduction histidine kinase
LTSEGITNGRDPAERLWALVDAGIAVSSQLDLITVLRSIVRTACEIIGTKYGAIGVIDSDGTALSNFIFHGVSDEERQAIGHLPVGRGLLGAVIDDPRPIRLDDIAADPRSVGFPQNHPPMTSFLGVPVQAKGNVFGNLYLTEKVSGASFTEEDERFAVALASQAAVAIENARLYAEAHRSERSARRRFRELELVQEIGAAMLGEFELTRLLRMITLRSRELVSADSSCIALHDESKTSFRVRMAAGRGASKLEGFVVPAEGSVSEYVTTTSRAQLLTDTRRLDGPAPKVADVVGARSAIFAPISDRGQNIGVLVVMSQLPDVFDDEDLFIVQRFADHASLALRNANTVAIELERTRMEVELRSEQVRAELRGQSLRAVIRAQEDERLRVARELHDSFGQTLASILLGLKIVEQQKTLADVRGRVADLREVTAEAAAEVRRISLELRPVALDDFGLVVALERLAREVEERGGPRVETDLGLADRFSHEVETVFYRVAQEALNNAVRCADASRISLSLAADAGQIRLAVEDDGVGFDPQSVDGEKLGIVGMRERAELIGGRLEVKSSPGAGTAVELTVPRARAGR